MKRTAAILALFLALSLLAACTQTPPAETTLPMDTTVPPETTLPVETTIPPETTQPVVEDPFAEYYTLLDYTYPETNWLRNAMGCVFETPSEIDLEFLFYAGFRDGSWDRISPESEQYLIDQGFWREMDLQPMPADQVEQVLNDVFGISLSECTIPDDWRYLEKEDFYCSNHNDAYGVYAFTITDVAKHGDGRVEIFYHVSGSFYNTKTDEFLDDVDLVLTLQGRDDGRYLIVSNVIQSEL